MSRELRVSRCMQPWRALASLALLVISCTWRAAGVRWCGDAADCDDSSADALRSAFIDATHLETSTNGSFKHTEVLHTGHRKHRALRTKKRMHASPPNWTQATSSTLPVAVESPMGWSPWLQPHWQNHGSGHNDSRAVENETSKQANQHVMTESELRYPAMVNLPSPSWHEVLLAIGGGTGASIGSTGNINTDRDLLRRMHFQDKAVIALVVLVYLVALAFSADLAYRQAVNNSPVTYYADPRFHSSMMEGNDVNTFLEAFNQPPKNIHLQVTGLIPVLEEDSSPMSVEWRGDSYEVVFTFALDLSLWVVRNMSLSEGGHLNRSAERDRMLDEGMLPEDREVLRHYLAHDKNDLSNVEILKQVSWPNWEELAANIKHQIRQRGFTGVITVHRSDVEAMTVYKNRPWANFMHAKTTKIICALSMIGWVVYAPYMWWKRTKVTVRSYFCVDLAIHDYWPLIADKLSGDVGFRTDGRQPLQGA